MAVDVKAVLGCFCFAGARAELGRLGGEEARAAHLMTAHPIYGRFDLSSQLIKDHCTWMEMTDSRLITPFAFELFELS